METYKFSDTCDFDGIVLIYIHTADWQEYVQVDNKGFGNAKRSL